MLGLMELVLFVFIFGYFFGKNRTNTMIEIITTRFHEAYTWILPPEQHVNHGNFIKEHQHQQQQHTFSSYKRLNGNSHKAPLLDGDKSTHNCNENIDSSETSSVLPSDGLICQDCSRNLNKKSQLNPINRALAAVDILKITRYASSNDPFDWGTYFPHFAQNVRLKKFEYKQIFNDVFNHKHVRNEINRVARNTVRESDVSLEEEDELYDKIVGQLTRRAHRLLIDMRCTLSDMLLRLTSYVLYKLLPCFLSGVVAHQAQIEMIKEAQQKMPNTPLVFLPLHRSHLDYILVTFILLNHDIQPPQVAAGDNLNIPVFGYLLRGLGAFYIKRKIDGPDGKKDYIYRSLLQAYLQEAITAGHNVEFFIEGGRTRTGKPLMPKSGILSVIVDSFINGLIDDAILVPVSVNYEKLVDGNFTNEQMGTPKKKESFTNAMRSIWKVINAKYGLMRIDFNEPFSLKELVKSFRERQEQMSIPHAIPSQRKLLTGPSTTSMYGIEVIDKHRELVDNIARHVVYDCSFATSVMSTNVLAFLLLNKYRNGVSMKELTQAVYELRQRIGQERDFAFESDSGAVIDAVKMGIELLGPELIEQKADSDGGVFIKPILTVPSVIETAYYSNTFTPIVSLDAAVVTSIAAMTKNNDQTMIAIKDVMDAATIYCDILKYEFIFHKPCQEFSEQIEKSVSRLCSENVLKRDGDMISMNSDAAQMYLSVMAPFNQAYVAVIKCLEKIIEKIQMTELDFIKFCLNHIQHKLIKGEISYGECLSTDTIKNCLKVLEKWGIVENNTFGGKRMLTLNSSYNSISGVQSAIEKVENFVILK